MTEVVVAALALGFSTVVTLAGLGVWIGKLSQRVSHLEQNTEILGRIDTRLQLVEQLVRIHIRNAGEPTGDCRYELDSDQ